MRSRLVASIAALAIAAGSVLAGFASAAPVSSAAATPGHYAETAYPQTKPNAGQFCKKADRGVVTKAANGRKVRCTAEGSRSRWKYV